MYFNFRKCNVVSLRVFVPWKGSGFTSKKYLNNSKKNMKFIARKVSLITVQLDYQKNLCRDPGLFRTRASSPDLNQGPSDLQSDALPTELSRQLRTC